MDKLEAFLASSPLSQIESILAQTGMGEITIRFILGLFLSFLAAIPMRAFPFFKSSRTLRHLFSLFIGLTLIWYVFHEGCLSALYSSSLGYICILFFHTCMPRSLSWAVAPSFLYMLYRHWLRSAADVTASDIDDSVLHLVLVVKLFTLTVGLQDGHSSTTKILEEGIAAEKMKICTAKIAGDNEGLKKATRNLIQLLERQSRAIRIMIISFPQENEKTSSSASSSSLPPPPPPPSSSAISSVFYYISFYIKYMAYLFNFTTVLVGPAFHFNKYMQWQEEEEEEEEKEVEKGRKTSKLGRIAPSLWKLLQGVVYLGIVATFQPIYHAEGMYRIAADAMIARETSSSTSSSSSSSSTLTFESLLSWTHIQHVLVFDNLVSFAYYACIANLLIRLQYYGVWKVSEAAAVMAGYGHRRSDRRRSMSTSTKSPPSLDFILPNQLVLFALSKENEADSKKAQANKQQQQPTDMSSTLSNSSHMYPQSLIRTRNKPLWNDIVESLRSLLMMTSSSNSSSTDDAPAAPLPGLAIRNSGSSKSLYTLYNVVGITYPPPLMPFSSSSSSSSDRAVVIEVDEEDWEGACNVNPLSTETRTTIQDVLGNWNMHVQMWLRTCIFDRTPRAYNRWITFLTSAVWHGFFPGYYASFLTIPLHQESIKYFQDGLAPHLEARFGWKRGQFPVDASPFHSFVGILWAILRWGINFTALTYALAPFILFTASKGMTVWAYCGYLGHVIPLGLLVVGLVLRMVAVPSTRLQKKSSTISTTTTTTASDSASTKKRN